MARAGIRADDRGKRIVLFTMRPSIEHRAFNFHDGPNFWLHFIIAMRYVNALSNGALMLPKCSRASLLLCV